MWFNLKQNEIFESELDSSGSVTKLTTRVSLKRNVEETNLHKGFKLLDFEVFDKISHHIINKYYK